MTVHARDERGYTTNFGAGAFEGSSKWPRTLALSFALCAIGYWCFAPLLQVFSRDASDATFSILFRLFVIVFVIWSYMVSDKKNLKIPLIFILPFILYCLAFLLRMYDNYFIQGYTVYLGPATTFFTFIGSGIAPALLVQRFAGKISDYHFAISILILVGIFLLGLSLNLDQLIETEIHRINLNKVNPISLTNISLTLAAGMVFMFGSGGKYKLLMVLSIPFLMAVAVLSKSRGPMVATGFAIVMVLILGRAKYRFQTIMAILLVIALGMTIGNSLGIDLFDLAFSRFAGGIEDGQVTVNERESMWRGAFDQFLAAPLFGEYMFELSSRMYPHNILVESLMATGVFGAIFLFIFIAQSFWAAARILASATASKFAIFMAFIFFKEFAQELSSGSAWAASTLWISGLTLIVLAIKAPATEGPNITSPKYTKQLDSFDLSGSR